MRADEWAGWMLIVGFLVLVALLVLTAIAIGSWIGSVLAGTVVL